MVSRAGANFQIKRISKGFRTLFRNRMATFGLVLILIFTFMALGTSLLTPYSPFETVSGSFAQPQWVMNFPDGYYFSQNILIGQDPSFVSPQSVTNEWTLGSPNGTLSTLPIHASYDPTVTATGDPGGSVKIVNDNGAS